MWLDAVALVILVFFAVIGAARGALASGFRLVTLLAAYGAAVAVAPLWGRPFAAALDLPAFLGVPLAGTAAFFATYALLGICTLVLRFVRGGTEHVPRGLADRLGGAAFGAVRGGLIVLLIGWLALWADALRATGQFPQIPDANGSAVAETTQTVVGAAARAALADSGAGGRLAAEMATRPAEVVEGLQGLIDNPRIRQLGEDRLFWSYLEAGAVDAAMNRGSMLGIAHDGTLRAELADLGLVGELAAEDPRAFRAEAKQMLVEVGHKLHEIKNDPELRHLADDPEIHAALVSGDTMTLMANPAFRSAVDRILSGSEQP